MAECHCSFLVYFSPNFAQHISRSPKVKETIFEGFFFSLKEFIRRLQRYRSRYKEFFSEFRVCYLVIQQFHALLSTHHDKYSHHLSLCNIITVLLPTFPVTFHFLIVTFVLAMKFLIIFYVLLLYLFCLLMNEAYYSCIQEAFTEHLLYAILFAIKRYEDVKINYLQFYQQSLNMSCHV